MKRILTLSIMLFVMAMHVCCGFPVGSNSCIPLIEGAPCSLDVTADHAQLTYNLKGDVEPCEVHIANSKLMKEKRY